MVDFNIRDALQRRFNRQNINQAKINVQSSAVNPDASGNGSTQNLVKQVHSNIINNLQQQMIMPQTVRMNHLASVDRSTYIKNLLKLPDNITDLLITFGNDKSEAEMKEALKQNQQVLNNLNNIIQQNQNRLNMQEALLNQRNNIQQNQQNQIQQGQQNQGQNQNNNIQQPNQPNQNVNNQPQVQPPYVPPSDKNNNSGDKVQQNPQQNNQNQNGKQDQNDIKQPPQNRLPNNPNEAFDKTLQDQIKNNNNNNNNQQQVGNNNNNKPQGEIGKPNQNPQTGQQGQIGKPNQNPQQPNLSNNGNNKPNVPNQPTQPQPNVPNRPNVPNQPLPPQQPNIPNRPNVPNQPLPPQQPNIPNRPNVPNQPLPPQQPNIPNRPNVPNQPLPPQQPNIPNRPNVPNQPMPPQQPNVPNRPNVPNQPMPPQQPNIPNRPNVPNQPTQPQPNVPNGPNIPNRPNVPNQPLPPQPNIPNISHRPNHSHKPDGVTGGASNINDSIIQEPENFNPSPRPTPANVNHRLHSQLMNNARFEPMANLRDSVRNHIRRPVELRPQAPTEQLQDEVSQELKQLQAQEATQIAQKQVAAKVLPSRVNLSVLNSQIQQHSKQALNNLVLEMSTATRQGITDTRPIQDTISLINSSISASSQDDTALAIKNLMLLYLPWLPLEEGVGFKLDVTTKKAEPPKEDDTSISIMITTKNYGNIGAEINLLTTNSVDIFITCDKTFPKEELLKRLNHDSKEHSMTASIGVEEISQQNSLEPDVQKAKVNLSNVTTINPYLLLMSHSFIRHAIEIDINTTMYGQPVES